MIADITQKSRRHLYQSETPNSWCGEWIDAQKVHLTMSAFSRIYPATIRRWTLQRTTIVLLYPRQVSDIKEKAAPLSIRGSDMNAWSAAASGCIFNWINWWTTGRHQSYQPFILIKYWSLVTWRFFTESVRRVGVSLQVGWKWPTQMVLDKLKSA